MTHSFWKWIVIFIVLFVVMVGAAWWFFPEEPDFFVQNDSLMNSTSQIIFNTPKTEPIQPIPLYIDLDSAKVALGDQLFHEVRLSHDNTMSCAYCHDLNTRGGTDHLPRSITSNGIVAKVNAPTVFNVGFNFKQLWDGRADTLEQQINGVVQSPKVMGSKWPEVVEKIRCYGEYEQNFKTLYPDGLTKANIIDAIANFERSLYTPNSRFDQFLRGNTTMLSDIEKRGYGFFLEFGCIVCHQGINIGGNMFQKMGAKNDYFKSRGNESKADLGRYNITGDEFDRYRFKVPSLRNIALTAPYFHNGSATSLEEAVSTMARFQLARTLSDDERRSIVAFLKTLTGEYKENPLF
ncbi:MAG: cytochrome c peroxidase [Candidatus Parabeggiatoa sp.]